MLHRKGGGDYVVGVWVWVWVGGRGRGESPSLTPLGCHLGTECIGLRTVHHIKRLRKVQVYVVNASQKKTKLLLQHNLVTLYAKSSLILGKNKAAFRREGQLSL